MLDKLAKKNIIHKNKAANIKSGVMAHINKLCLLYTSDAADEL